MAEKVSKAETIKSAADDDDDDLCQTRLNTMTGSNIKDKINNSTPEQNNITQSIKPNQNKIVKKNNLSANNVLTNNLSANITNSDKIPFLTNAHAFAPGLLTSGGASGNLNLAELL